MLKGGTVKKAPDQMKTAEHIQLFKKYGEDIVKSDNFRTSSKYVHHGKVSVKKHSETVALEAIRISRALPIGFDERALVRGALLHDYFLYDWHEQEKIEHRLLNFYKMHGFTHPSTALYNARQEFELTPVEEDIIKKHMWPLTIIPPMCREAWVVTLADKSCAVRETLKRRKKKRRKKSED